MFETFRQLIIKFHAEFLLGYIDLNYIINLLNPYERVLKTFCSHFLIGILQRIILIGGESRLSILFIIFYFKDHQTFFYVCLSLFSFWKNWIISSNSLVLYWNLESLSSVHLCLLKPFKRNPHTLRVKDSSC